MVPRKRKIATVFGVLLALPLAAYIGLAVLMEVGRAKGYVWIFPDGCQGFVRVDFGASDAPPLPVEDGFGVIIVPGSGEVRTSSRMVPSPTDDRYWYERDGRRVDGPRPISGWTIQTGEAAQGRSDEITLHFFFGTAETLKAMGFTENDRKNPRGRLVCDSRPK